MKQKIFSQIGGGEFNGPWIIPNGEFNGGLPMVQSKKTNKLVVSLMVMNPMGQESAKQNKKKQTVPVEV